ncbi:condensin complex subunit 2/barren [Halteromyces radiatus]|uniref:condensin complex subunit 2/barren n=1 Tax=Halteromyces radiatus TaxID=101107 RepID=UPI00221EFBA5|nr:condensin complex subunit 2/barren [Halteromyces radiatus]KAI8086723.1 condensin complex subunit 2/barren [Halteromyces radiatus]
MLQKRPRSDHQSNRDRLTRNVLSRQNNDARSVITVPASLPVLPTVSPEQMYSNFEEWIKMATDNKINAANSWNFALIDYFHEMTFIREGDSINFQRASCTLDGCVKIYTSRVDSVATETGKLLTGLTDHAKDDGEDGSQDGEDGVHERRVRRRAHRSEATLLKDFSSLALKKLDVDFAVDPLFKKTSADFDEGGARGLLLNHLNLDQDCKIIFDSSDARPEDDEDKHSETETSTQVFSDITTKERTDDNTSTRLAKSPDDDDDEDDEGMDIDELEHQIKMGSQMITMDDPGQQLLTEQQDIDISNLKAKIALDESFDDLHICPTLSQVNFFTDATISIPGTDKDINMNDDNKNQDGNTLDEHYDYGFDTFDFDEDNEQEGELMDPFADNDISQINDTEQDDLVNNTGLPGDTTIDQVTTISTSQENELLSYFDTTLTKNWAGPAHWKLRRTKTIDALHITGSQPIGDNEHPPPKERPQKKPTVPRSMIDFLEGEDIVELDIFAKSKRSIIINHPKEHLTYLLPDDEQFSSKQLLRYFLKPVFSLSRYKGTKPRGDNVYETSHEPLGDDFNMDQEPDIEYWANADSGGGYTQDIDNDDDDNLQTREDTMTPFDDVSGFQDTFIEDTFDNEGSATYGDQLITNHQVKKIKPPYVNYARTAKRVDVRKLKENLWKALTLPPTDGNEHQVGKVYGERKFTEVLQDLKKMYTPQTMKDISVPFCFICLLHLANEQNLTITGLGRDDQDDDFVLGDDPHWMSNEDLLSEVKIVQVA